MIRLNGLDAPRPYILMSVAPPATRQGAIDVALQPGPLVQIAVHRLDIVTNGGGVGEIYGEILRKNAPMLVLCDKLGFRQSAVPGDPSIIHVGLDLRT